MFGSFLHWSNHLSFIWKSNLTWHPAFLQSGYPKPDISVFSTLSGFISVQPWFSNISVFKNHVERSFKYQFQGLTCSVCFWDGAWELAFVTSSQQSSGCWASGYASGSSPLLQKTLVLDSSLPTPTLSFPPHRDCMDLYAGPSIAVQTCFSCFSSLLRSLAWGAGSLYFTVSDQ